MPGRLFACSLFLLAACGGAKGPAAPVAPPPAAPPAPESMSCADLPAAFDAFVATHATCVRDDDCAVVDWRSCGDCAARLTERGTAVARDARAGAERLIRRHEALSCAGEDNSHCDVFGVDLVACQAGRCVASASRSFCRQSR